MPHSQHNNTFHLLLPLTFTTIFWQLIAKKAKLLLICQGAEINEDISATETLICLLFSEFSEYFPLFPSLFARMSTNNVHTAMTCNRKLFFVEMDCGRCKKLYYDHKKFILLSHRELSRAEMVETKMWTF